MILAAYIVSGFCVASFYAWRLLCGDNTKYNRAALSLGLLLAVSMLRYCLKAKVARRQWVLEHIGSFIGSGIGAYTAFLAFGGRTLFEGLGYWQLVFWIAPGVVGSIASAILCRKYAKIFQVTSEDVGAKPAGA